jgi:hypothetical protein
MSGARTVSVSVDFAQPVPAGATVHVIVEDTTRADAAATVVAEAVEPLTQPLKPGERRVLRLTVPEVDDHARYGVRVHVDCSGSGEVSAGDRITTRAYPVLTYGAADHVEAAVVEI